AVRPHEANDLACFNGKGHRPEGFDRLRRGDAYEGSQQPRRWRIALREIVNQQHRCTSLVSAPPPTSSHDVTGTRRSGSGSRPGRAGVDRGASSGPYALRLRKCQPSVHKELAKSLVGTDGRGYNRIVTGDLRDRTF